MSRAVYRGGWRLGGWNDSGGINSRRIRTAGVMARRGIENGLRSGCGNASFHNSLSQKYHVDFDNSLSGGSSLFTNSYNGIAGKEIRSKLLLYSNVNNGIRFYSQQKKLPGSTIGTNGNQTSTGISFLPPNYSSESADLDDDFVYDWAFDQMSKDTQKKPINDISCTILDEHGKVVAVSKKFPRREFLKEHNLHPRDLRNFDSGKVTLIPSILVRKDCILVNMLELKAIIRHNQVLIFDSVDKDNKALIAKLSILVYDLENKLGSASVNQEDINGFSTSQSYELKALESILMHAVSSLDIELKDQLSVLNGILIRLEDHIDRDLLKELLVRNRSMSLFYQKILLTRNVINDLLDNDEDLVALYLTEKFHNIERDETDHAEVELLLESYYKQIDEIVQQAEGVISNVKSTEEIINIMLDANRNSLMLFELKITIGTLGTTIGMFFAALYGMNLKNFIEESEYGFIGSIAVITAISTIVTYYNFKKLAIVKRITLIGHGDPTIFNLHNRALLNKLNASKHIPPQPHYPSKLFWLFRRKRHHPNEYDQHKRAITWRWLVEKRDT